MTHVDNRQIMFCVGMHYFVCKPTTKVSGSLQVFSRHVDFVARCYEIVGVVLKSMDRRLAPEKNLVDPKLCE